MWIRTDRGDLLNLAHYRTVSAEPNGSPNMITIYVEDAAGERRPLVSGVPETTASELVDDLARRALHAAEISADGRLTVRK